MKCACGKSFRVKKGPGPKYRRCPRCRQREERRQRRDRLKRHRQKSGPRKLGVGYDGKQALKAGVVVTTRGKLAAQVGLPGEDQVREIELAALHKLRAHPLHDEVLSLWREWVSEGKPRPPKRDVGEVLLEHQAQVAAFYEQYERLLPIAPDEAREILDEIERYQNKLGDTVRELLNL